MNGMEHAVEQATERAERVLAPYFRNAALGEVEDDTHLGALVLRAVDALAEAGLLAPAPFREEWETTFPNGRRRPGKDMPLDSWWKGYPLEGRNVRRYVTDWEVER